MENVARASTVCALAYYIQLVWLGTLFFLCWWGGGGGGGGVPNQLGKQNGGGGSLINWGNRMGVRVGWM